MSAKRRKIRKSSRNKRRRVKQHSHAEKKSTSGIFKPSKKQKAVEEIPREPITGRRLWLFRIIAITVIPALLFLLLEITLRVAGYGFPTHIAIKSKINSVPSYSNNNKFAWRFFHPNIARTTDPFVFPVNKPDNTYRVFVMGASAAAGTPDGAFSFGRILQAMLRYQYPKTNFEVMVPAMPAINSHVVLEVAEDCAQYQSDLFIIYLGNNEVVGPYGAGTVFSSLSPNLSLIRFGIALKATKLGQLMNNLLDITGSSDRPKVWRGMEMFLEKQVRADNVNLPIVYSHFQRNLEDIRRLATRRGIKIIFCTVPGNLKDSPPFASLHRADITDAEKKSWEEFYQQGIKFEADSNYTQAVEQYLAATDIDGSYADLQFRLGWCYWAMGDYEKGRGRYVQARELDTLRFRADNQINEIIRSVARDRTDEDVYLLDAVKTFEENSSYDTAGKELFYEHVHMNFNGNYILAKAIYEQVEKILPDRIKTNKTKERPFPDKEECARNLAYTDWEEYKIYSVVLNDYIKQVPFTNQLYHDQRVSQMEQDLKNYEVSFSPEVVAEIDAQYRWSIEQMPSDWWLYWKYGEFLNEREKSTDAIRQYRSVLDYFPYHYEAYAKIGLLFGKGGDINAAIENNLKAVQIYPIFAEAYFNLGFAYHLQKKFDEAIEYYTKTLRLVPDRAEAYINLGLVLFQHGKVAEAMETYQSGLKVLPDNLDLHYNLGILLGEQGQRQEALKELRAALKIDPNSVKVRKVLRTIQKRK